MCRSFILERWVAVLLCLPVLTVCLAVEVVAQSSEPAFLSAPEFILSDTAIAAGIDGAYKASLSIDEAGNVKNVRLYGDPAWPCGASPKDELKAVRVAVENHLRLVKFKPAMKDGKPKESDVMLDFAIGDAFKRARSAEDSKGSVVKIVKAGIVNGRATHLARPHSPGTRGIAAVQVVIDEEGNVVKAGAIQGNPTLFASVRNAACQSKFSPTIIDGKAVQVTGVITYQIR